MAFSIEEAIRQNTVGYSEGRPLGVPESYSWYQGAVSGASAPPSTFTSVTGWGQVYQESGEPARTNGNVEVANARTYVHLRSTGEWVLVQDQASNQLAGAHFVTDFAGNGGYGMRVTTGAGGSASFVAPPGGYNDHFWHGARGTFRAGDVDAVYVQMDMRVTDPGLNLIANVGADWWRDANAPYVDGFGNNPGAGMSNWVELSTQWETLAFYSSRAIIQADPPPPLAGAVTETPPRPTPSEPPISDNLLVNGSFEASVVGTGNWQSARSVAGWTAVSGSEIELWNNLNGVRASDGSNFGELDFRGARDGFYQDVRTVAGQSYQLTFDSRARPGVATSTSTIEVLWNGQVVASLPPGSQWSTSSFRVTGTGGHDRLTFREAGGQGGDGVGALYDNVRLVTTGASSPTPPTIPGPTTPTPTPPTTTGNLLVNGSFEASTIASNRWEDFDSIPGWTAVSGGTIELWNNLNGVKASTGSNYGELDYLGARDGLQQAVRTEAGQTYTLSFDARLRPGTPTSTSTIEVLWNNSVVARVPPDSDWSSHQFSVTGTGGADRLTLREAEGQSSDGHGALYDNVSLVRRGSSTGASDGVEQLDRALELMSQQSASMPPLAGMTATSMLGPNSQQESLVPTLTNTHHLQ